MEETCQLCSRLRAPFLLKGEAERERSKKEEEEEDEEEEKKKEEEKEEKEMMTKTQEKTPRKLRFSHMHRIILRD